MDENEGKQCGRGWGGRDWKRGNDTVGVGIVSWHSGCGRRRKRSPRREEKKDGGGAEEAHQNA